MVIAVSDFDDYDAQIDDFQRRREWSDMINFCSRTRKALEATVQDPAQEADSRYRLLSFVYIHLARAYSMTGEHKKCVSAARKSITTLLKVDPDTRETHFGYSMLARYHEQFGDLAAARVALVRSLTCIVTKRQSEFIACSLTDLHGLGTKEGAVSDDLDHLARQIRTERRWASATVKDIR